jgi:hypothetical protein
VGELVAELEEESVEAYPAPQKTMDGGCGWAVEFGQAVEWVLRFPGSQ